MKHAPAVIRVPQLGLNEDTARIYWETADLAHVAEGQQVLVLESSKAAVDIESPRSGIVKRLAGEGDDVRVGQALALVGESEEELAVEAKIHAQQEKAPADAAAATYGNGPLATDKARRLAAQLGVDLSHVHCGGIIREADVLNAHNASRSAPSVASLTPGEGRVIIHGCGNGARTMLECLDLGGQYTVACFIDYKGNGPVEHCGRPVLPESALPELAKAGFRLLALVTTESALRLGAFKKWSGTFDIINVIHPTAFVSPSCVLGKGNFIKARAVLETRTRVGNACFVDNGTVIPHDNIIEDGCHIAPGVTLGSSVRVGQGSIVGIGASVATGVTIGRACVIGVGAALTMDVADEEVVAGNPAKVVGNRTRQEPPVRSGRND